MIAGGDDHGGHVCGDDAEEAGYNAGLVGTYYSIEKENISSLAT